MRIAICDDEKEIRNSIEKYVRLLHKNAEIVLFDNGISVLEYLEQIDILFLDIQMVQMDGMETARALRKTGNNSIIIFVTAIEEYVFQAFDVGAFHYLLKPIDHIKFIEVLERAVEEYQTRTFESKESDANYIMIHSSGVHIKVMIHDIVYAEVFNRKVLIHKLDSDLEYYGKMSDLERVAGDNFFRPHRAYLINFKYVVKYDATTIYLDKGTALMAKQNYPKFVKMYMKYNQRKGQ